MNKHAWWSLVLLAITALLAFFLIQSEKPGARFPYRFGLDLIGGTELVYKADTSNVQDVGGAMESLKEVIERRVNIFGVSEPLIQVEEAGIVSGNRDERLIVELPGVTDLDRAITLIGETPTLEFRLAKPDSEEIITANPEATIEELFAYTGLTGRYLERAQVNFEPMTNAPVVGLTFNSEGADLFSKLTRENKGKVLAIILDGGVLSAPVIQDEITNGQAVITGQFSANEAKSLVRNLNYGALPVPIQLSTSQTIGASLGESALTAGIEAGVIGFIALAIFLIFWYRLPGFIAVVSLVIYIILSLVAFKLIPVTLTAAGIAGFVLSIGMAVDANVLIFERMKEELKKGRSIHDALHEGFHRAWLSIRDSNVSSTITAVVLFWLGTSAVKGFALTLGVGVLISMFTAITVTRTFLYAIAPNKSGKIAKFLFSNGVTRTT